MDQAPPDLAELEAFREREASKRFSLADLKADELNSQIVVRRFAGPSSFVGRVAPIRVAHLTDLHVGRVTPMRVQRAAVELANAANPDFVVLTGDFVCHSQHYLDALEELVRDYRAPVYAVLGNHDHWSGGKEVAQALERAGAVVLNNAHTTIDVNGSRLQILGLDDAYTGHARRDVAVRGLDPSLPTLGLSHIAEEADGLWAHGVGLVLSGHTHAGQVTLAGLHELALGRMAGHKYIHGLYGTRVASPGRGAVYVGAGIGAAVMPIRLGTRGKREVTIFELGMEPGIFSEDHIEQEALPGRKPSAGRMAARAQAVIEKHRKREKRRVKST